jgi:serine/threonine-protein phosphatase 2B catalytic subunit
MEPLLDPLNDRVLTNLIPPPSQYLSRSLLFPNSSLVPNWQILKNHLQKEGKVLKSDCLQITTQATKIFTQEPNLLELMDPVTIIGDIHGQYYDLLSILELAGNLSNTKYLFLGDFVDRGCFSVEILLLLYSLKINFPTKVFLLRGNHESRQLTTFFNFRSECLKKYDLEVYDIIMTSFDALPLACIVNRKFLAVHGGISPYLKNLADIVSIPRFIDPPTHGLLCDLLWSDPIENDTGKCSEKYQINEDRGCSYYYGAAAVNFFLQENKLLSIIRAHQAQSDGYKMHKWNGDSEFPVVITVFSAPNYCDVYKNKGAILKFINNTLHVEQYNYNIHPYILPEFMDVFEWSIPYIIEKILHMLHAVLKKGKNEKSQKINIKDIEKELKNNKHEKIKQKIKGISKMIKMLKVLRTDNELILQLKGMCPDNKIPKGLLQNGPNAILAAIQVFKNAKKWDMINEKRPN